MAIAPLLVGATVMFNIPAVSLTLVLLPGTILFVLHVNAPSQHGQEPLTGCSKHPVTTRRVSLRLY